MMVLNLGYELYKKREFLLERKVLRQNSYFAFARNALCILIIEHGYDTVQKDKDCLDAGASSSAFLFCGVSLMPLYLK